MFDLGSHEYQLETFYIEFNNLSKYVNLVCILLVFSKQKKKKFMFHDAFCAIFVAITSRYEWNTHELENRLGTFKSSKMVGHYTSKLPRGTRFESSYLYGLG